MSSEPPPSRRCLERIQRDLRAFARAPLPDIYLAPNPTDLCRLRVLIVGPENSPYVGGCFQFCIRFPDRFPSTPPTVHFLSTDDERVAFGPHLPASGAICPSPYGPWPASNWSQTHTLTGILLTLQSLFSSHPLDDQPVSRDLAEAYNVYLRHETIRVAVCDALESCFESDSNFPPNFRRAIYRSFEGMFQGHMAACAELASGGLTLTTALRQLSGFLSPNFRYLEPFPKLQERLQALREQMKPAAGPLMTEAKEEEEENWFQGWRLRRSLVESDRGKENARPRLHVRRSLDPPPKRSGPRRSAPAFAAPPVFEDLNC